MRTRASMRIRASARREALQQNAKRERCTAFVPGGPGNPLCGRCGFGGDLHPHTADGHLIVELPPPTVRGVNMLQAIVKALTSEDAP